MKPSALARIPSSTAGHGGVMVRQELAGKGSSSADCSFAWRERGSATKRIVTGR
ncbi:MAG: hypothetical protein ACLTLQ_10850 [[Clostridium] scindens]